jgi:hypothetical protein
VHRFAWKKRESTAKGEADGSFNQYRRTVMGGCGSSGDLPVTVPEHVA